MEQPKAQELEQVRKTLEGHFKDMQDFEFTIEDGKPFYMPQRATATDRLGGRSGTRLKWSKRN